LFAAGGVALEKYCTARLAWIKYATLIFMVLSVVPVLPYSLPVLSLDKMVDFGKLTGKYIGYAPLRWERGEIHSLPQDYADMTGWAELSELVQQAYTQLSAVEKSDYIIYAENYGQAASVHYYTHKLGMPEPICFSDNFALWAPDSLRRMVMIYINDDTTDANRLFGRVVEVGRIQNLYARETGLPVFVCHEPKAELFQFYAATAKRVKDRYR